MTLLVGEAVQRHSTSGDALEERCCVEQSPDESVAVAREGRRRHRDRIATRQRRRFAAWHPCRLRETALGGPGKSVGLA